MDRGTWGEGLVPAVEFRTEGGEDGMVGFAPLLSSQAVTHVDRAGHICYPLYTYLPCSLRFPEIINHLVCENFPTSTAQSISI